MNGKKLDKNIVIRFGEYYKHENKEIKIELEEIVRLIKEGKSVLKKGLEDRVRNNVEIIILIKDDNGEIIAVGAIKKPLEGENDYKNTKVFKPSNTELNYKDYKYELGWVSVSEKNQDEGLGTLLVKYLVDEFKKRFPDERCYATTKTNKNNIEIKERMEKVLINNKFKSTGETFKGKTTKRDLMLYVLE